MSQAQLTVEQTRILHEAQLDIGSGRSEAALVALAPMARTNPQLAEPWLMAAQALSRRAHFLEALTAVDEAVRIEPDNVPAHELRTALLLQLGRRIEALAAAERLTAIAPDRAEAHAFLAFGHAFAGSRAQALEAAAKALHLAPARAIGHQAACVVHLTFAHWQKAEYHATKALALEGPNASLYHDLAVAQFEQGMIDESDVSIRRAAALDPRFASAGERLRARHVKGVHPLPTIVTFALGIAIVPFGSVAILFPAVVAIAVASFMVAAMRTGKRKTLDAAPLKLGLVVVLLADLQVAVEMLSRTT